MTKRILNRVMCRIDVVMGPRKKQILKTMGIPVWTAHRNIADQNQLETDLTEDSACLVESTLLDSASSFSAQPAVDAWPLLRQEVSQCTACELHQSRSQTVFGVGDQQANLMIIGEAPGEDEDLSGEPFVGPAGHLLNQMLFALGFSRENVFISNILKCSPPDNRKPLLSEIETCSTFLLRQIALIKPKVILCVGAVSAKNLLRSNERIGKLRGQVMIHAQTSTPLIATYHPAYLLRKPTEKRAVWSDLLLVKKILAES